MVLVSGLRGGGKSALVRRALVDYAHLAHVCPPLPDPEQRRLLAERVRGLDVGDDPPAAPSDADWADLLDALLHRLPPRSRPFVLVLDDAHRLGEARSRSLDPLMEMLRRAADEEVVLHVVLVGHGSTLPELDADDERFADRVGLGRIRVGPLPFRAAASLLPGKDPVDRIRAYGVFGGIPRILEMLDDSVTVGTNVRRLALEPNGPLADLGAYWLERDLQTPARYYAIMSALAHGEADWSAVHAGVSDLTRSGQVAPYLNRLIELGLVQARRSIDASPGSRSTRYALTDPFLAFWFRFAFPLRFRPSTTGDGARDTGESARARQDGGRAAQDGTRARQDGGRATPVGDRNMEDLLRTLYARRVRPLIDDHMRSVFPLVCRQHMTFDAIETLGAVAREGGSLWGGGYDLPVAGTLTSGAVYYGACRWDPGAEEGSPLVEIEESLRETRYGFGRERRLRLVFTGRTPSVALRRAAVRTRDAELIDAEALLG